MAIHLQKIHKQRPIAVVGLYINPESSRQVDVTSYAPPMLQSDLN